jgi:hypothetical protein
VFLCDLGEGRKEGLEEGPVAPGLDYAVVLFMSFRQLGPWDSSEHPVLTLR